jgi:hypothetical protein
LPIQNPSQGRGFWYFPERGSDTLNGTTKFR